MVGDFLYPLSAVASAPPELAQLGMAQILNARLKNAQSQNPLRARGRYRNRRCRMRDDTAGLR